MATKCSVLSLPLPKEIIASLTNAGYSTVGDLGGTRAENLMQELNISEDIAEQIINLTVPTSTVRTMPMTQSVAALAQQSQHISTGCVTLNKILGGGLQRGHILEVSGQPGSPKELIARNIVAQFAQPNLRTIIIDCQNMVDLWALQRSIPRQETMRSIQYKRIMALPELMLLFEQLPSLLDVSNQDTLLVVSAISFPFQNPEISPARRAVLLQRVKQILAKITSSSHVTVVTTSHLATKMVNSDGTVGSFDTGVQGIMVPQLGSLYLPAGKAWRVMVAPDGQTSGFLRLLSSPKQETEDFSLVVPYSLVPVAQ